MHKCVVLPTRLHSWHVLMLLRQVKWIVAKAEEIAKELASEAHELIKALCARFFTDLPAKITVHELRTTSVRGAFLPAARTLS